MAASPLRGFLTEQRKVKDDNAVGASVDVDLGLDLGLHRGVHDAVEILKRLLITEHDRGHSCTIKRTVLIYDPDAEPIGHCIK